MLAGSPVGGATIGNPAELETGRAVAEKHCSGCHLFPEPRLLDRQTWVSGALRKMTPLLGIGRRDLSQRPDRTILEESGIFPDHPLVSEEDWRAIVRFYSRAAPVAPLSQPPRASIHPQSTRFSPRVISPRFPDPMVTLVQIDASRGLLYVGDGVGKSLLGFSLFSSNRYQPVFQIPCSSPPVQALHRAEGIYTLQIGQVFPSDLRDGTLDRFFQEGSVWRTERVLSGLQRPVHALFADLDGDKVEDLCVSSFGNQLGRLAWYRSIHSSRPEQHWITPNPGSLGSVIRDMDGDGSMEVIALIAQGRESLRSFSYLGAGEFQEHILLEFSPVHGSTSFECVDFDRDGKMDVLMTNGDNGEYASPFKHYHGIRLYRGVGAGRLEEAFFYPLNGAFKALARDFDEDGDLDIAAISFFPNYPESPEESFVYLENRGGWNFEASSGVDPRLGRWLVMDSGDADGDGDLDIVLGSFAQGPPSVPIPTVVRESWRTNGVGVLILENQLR